MHIIRQKSGFTLVELSIVLVIIGLIVGGVLVGRDLIKASELRKTIQEVEMLNSAVNAFRLKYNCIPGDCPNATSLWGAATCPLDWGRGATSPQTCNGNGDGMILDMTETFSFTAQLYNAGMIDQQAYTEDCCGKFSGDSPNAYQSKAFGSKWSGQTGYVPYFNTDYSLTAIYAAIGVDYPFKWFFTRDNKHYWILGGTEAARSNLPNLAPIMSAAQAYNIDSKIDDGKPGKGTMQGINQQDFYSLWQNKGIPYCTDTNDANTAVYNITGSGDVDTCSVFFRMGF